MLNYKSQSYIEVIVAVGLITVALLAIIGLGTAQLRLIGQSAKKLTAYNLASEGIEICEAIRMDQWLDSENIWPYGLEGGNWVLDYDSVSTTVAADNADLLSCTNCYLCKQGDDSFKSCSDASATFKRMIEITDITPNEEIKIISKVRYQVKNTWRNIETETYLTDWLTNE